MYKQIAHDLAFSIFSSLYLQILSTFQFIIYMHQSAHSIKLQLQLYRTMVTAQHLGMNGRSLQVWLKPIGY